MSVLSKKRAVREKGGIKSPVLTNLEKETQVTVLETMETWSKVVTPDGHMGYVENKVLGEIQNEAFFRSRTSMYVTLPPTESHFEKVYRAVRFVPHVSTLP